MGGLSHSAGGKSMLPELLAVSLVALKAVIEYVERESLSGKSRKIGGGACDMTEVMPSQNLSAAVPQSGNRSGQKRRPEVSGP